MLKSYLKQYNVAPIPTQYYLVLNKDFNIIISFFKSLYNFLIELNNIFHVKGFLRFTFDVKLIDDSKKTQQEKYGVT